MRRLTLVFLLLALASAVELIGIWRSVVPALDCGRYLTTAEWIDRAGLRQVVSAVSEHPLFAVWVLVVRKGLVACFGEFPRLGAASVQLAAAVPLVLAVVPVLWSSWRLYGLGAAVAGAYLFCLLPEVARLGPDGISDSTHLLLFALAFLACVRYFCGRQGRGAMAAALDGRPAAQQEPSEARAVGSPWWLLLAGIATGLAALVRVEALLLVLAAIGALVVVSTKPTWRRPRADVAGAGLLLAGLLLTIGPYLAWVGATTPRAALARVIGGPGSELPSAVPSMGVGPLVTAWQLPDGQAMSFSGKAHPGSTRQRGLGGALRLFARELIEAFWYWVGLLGLFGLWSVRDLRGRPVDWFVRILLVGYSLAMIAFAAREGYLSARHLLPLVVAAIGCCGFGAVVAGRDLARASGRLGLRPAVTPVCTAIVVIAAGGACLVQTWRPVGRCAAAHRAAGEWLAAEPRPGTVIDTKGWSRLYSGRQTFHYADGPAAFGDPGVAFVVVEPWELEGDSPRSRTLRHLLLTAGEPVAGFTGPGEDLPRDVMVYRWRPDRLRSGVTPAVAASHAPAPARVP